MSDDFSEVFKYLHKVETRLREPSQFWRKSIAVLAESAKKTFNLQGRPGWKPRVSTKERHPILDRTGRMRDSMEMTTGTRDAVVRITTSSRGGSLEKGTTVPYAKYHQVQGVGRTKTLRQFIDFYDTDADDIMQAGGDYFFPDH